MTDKERLRSLASKNAETHSLNYYLLEKTGTGFAIVSEMYLQTMLENDWKILEEFPYPGRLD